MAAADMRQDIDVAIVGAGPAGISTALHLIKRSPSWAERILVFEKAAFPRDKLCAGGLTRMADRVLAGLGLELGVPSQAVRNALIRVGSSDITFSSEPAFRVADRREFDNWLANEARQRGVEIREHEPVRGLEVRDSGVELETSRGRYRAKLVIAADGSNSVVRKALGLPTGRRSRLLEVVTPEVPDETPEFRDSLARFDFGDLGAGPQGYFWDFPTRTSGAAHVNRGVFDSQAVMRHEHFRLATAFEQALELRQRRLGDTVLKGNGIRWFQPLTAMSAKRVLLVGDAAGSDALFGEGISFALAYGDLASALVSKAIVSGDYSFRRYAFSILSTPWGRNLLLRRVLAPLPYSRLTRPVIGVLWKLLAKSLDHRCRIGPARIEFQSS